MSSARVDPVAAEDHFAALERKYDARLGVYAMATGTSVAIAYHADDPFAFASTYQTLAAAAVLRQRPLSYLDTVVRYVPEDVNSFSPVTREHIETGLTIRELCDAAVRFGDGTAAGLLMRDIGGPEQLTAYLRSLGDTVSRIDLYEPELGGVAPGDPRGATTPRALAADYQQIVLRAALAPQQEVLLKDWLEHGTTGADTIRAGVPAGWTVAGQAGLGGYGRACDAAVVRPPGGAPLVLTVLTDRPGPADEPRPAMIADAARYVIGALYRTPR